jgi:ABC-type transport system involved in multi-copper enzyme maturation permease subunit
MKYAIGLPLIAKELTELAARKRTFVLRVLIGAALAFAAGVALFQAQRWGQELLGQGMRVFEILANLIAWLPVAIAPALVAGAIAGEREDGSLPLLQMTRLGPVAIVLEKWLSRLIAVVMLQVLALPLLALAYTFGGVPEGVIWWTILGAVAAAAHATALAMFATAWCRGTVGALFVGCGLVLASYGIPMAIENDQPLVLLHANCPAINVIWLLESNASRHAAAQSALLMSFAVTGLAVLSAFLALALRRHREGGNPLLERFRRLDGWFEGLERRLLGRATRRDLPLDRPVAWRECNRRALANPRYLARILVPVGALVVIGLVLTYGLAYSSGRDVAAWTGMFIEIGLSLTVLVLGATAFSAERSAQSLEVLLTTPLTPRDILMQKVSGLRRVHLGGAILVTLVLLVRLLVDVDDGNMWRGRWSLWLAVLSLALQPVVMGWLGLVVGLHVRSRSRAVGTAVGVAVGWTVAAGLMVAFLDVVWSIRDEEVWMSVLSPSILGVINHHSGFRSGEQWAAGLAFLVCQVIAISALRSYATVRAAELLRRN